MRVAADPATRSPARLAEAGPWWDFDPEAASAAAAAAVDTEALECELDAVDGMRTRLQAQARADLTSQSRTLTRAAVLARAVELLREEAHSEANGRADEHEVTAASRPC